MQRYWLLAAGAGLASAGFFVAGHTGSLLGLFLAYLSPAPIFIAALGLGGTAGIAAAGAGVVAVMLAGGFLAGIVYAAAAAAPAALLGRSAMLSRSDASGAVEWYPTGGLASTLTLIGLAAFALLCAVMALEEGGVSGAAGALLEELTGRVQVKEQELFIRFFQPVLPGLSVGSWMLFLAINGALAQGVLAGAGRAVRPSPRMGDLYLPRWVAAVGAVAALAALLLGGEPGYIATNLVIVAAVPYFLQGLAVVHVLAERTGGGGMLLAVFYVMLVVLAWAGAPLVVMLGLVEQLVGMRRYLERNNE